MKLTETISANALQVEQTLRSDEIRALTSGDAGRVLPLAFAPILREDRVSRGKARIRVETGELGAALMTGINVTAYAHFIPKLAAERFNGLDQLNRAYKGEPETEGGAVVPYFETIAYDRNAALFKTMGIHAKQGAAINSDVVEAYNILINHRRRARSTKLPVRAKNDTSLARAFWKNTAFRHIVPDFDQAAIDGEVALNVVSSLLPVRGLGVTDTPVDATTQSSVKYTGGTSGQAIGNRWVGTSVRVPEDPDNPGFPAVFAELQDRGIVLSLQNIEIAKKTAAFARLREQYRGMSDDYIIDLLMDGLRVPDAQLSQPILIDRQSAILGMSKRHATDGANLDKFVTNGATVLDLNVRLPRMNVGGLVLITLEIVPEQMFERQTDAFLALTSPDELPAFTRDFLDPEKVSVVKNKFVDVEHSVPDGTFGYAPLNHEWKRNLAKIGGKFHRQIGDPFVEDRQRIWSVETVDPSLTEDFYLVNELPKTIFADTLADSFEITTLAKLDIVGNTVFGKGLSENAGDYAAIDAKVDDTRIDQGA